MVELWPALGLKFMKQQRSVLMSMAHGTTKGPIDVPGLDCHLGSF